MILLLYYIACTDLLSLNGAIIYSPTSSPRLEGTTATYSCDSGYVLSGGTVRTCQADGTWSGRNSVCQGDYTPISNK